MDAQETRDIVRPRRGAQPQFDQAVDRRQYRKEGQKLDGARCPARTARAPNLKCESLGFSWAIICDSPLLEVDYGEEQFIGFAGSDHWGD